MFTRLILLAIVLGACTACQKQWALEVKQVGNREVELYLNQPASDSFYLGGMTLSWEGHAVVPAGSAPGPAVAPRGQVDLSVLGTNLNGGQFLIVWEDRGYTGSPVAARFSRGQLGYVAGIKVPAGFFDMIDQVPAIVRVSGSRTDALIVTHKVSDMVCFGLPAADRPSDCASFTTTGQIPNPTGSGGPQRKWNGTDPVDTDSEDDWKFGVNAWGVPTP
jgi:hypothetical protein